MKRIGYLYDEICSRKNIALAIKKSSKGKTKRYDVKRVLFKQDLYIEKIHNILVNKTYYPSEFNVSIIYDRLNKKERTISKPKYYPDQIVQYCLMNVLEPILLKRFYEYSCGNIIKKGTSYGQKMIRYWMDNDKKNTKYCLKMDIKKYYPSVNKELLKLKFEKVLKDSNTLELINKIIDSICDGLPLGNYTSASFANFYLNDLDIFLKEKNNIKYYVRYVDDLILFSGNKKKLYKFIGEVKRFLKEEKLELKGNYQIFNLENRDLDFLGLRFFRDKTILRKRNMYRISRRALKISKKKYVDFKDACAMVSYYGWIKRSNSYNFYNKRIKKMTSIREMKKVISDTMKSIHL